MNIRLRLEESWAIRIAGRSAHFHVLEVNRDGWVVQMFDVDGRVPWVEPAVPPTNFWIPPEVLKAACSEPKIYLGMDADGNNVPREEFVLHYDQKLARERRPRPDVYVLIRPAHEDCTIAARCLRSHARDRHDRAEERDALLRVADALDPKDQP